MSELVDHERAWLHLKAYIGTKRNHGAGQLLEVMARLEVESMYAESGAGAAPENAAPSSENGQLDADAADAPSAATPDDKPLTPEEASWTPTHPTPASPTPTSPTLRAA